MPGRRWEGWGPGLIDLGWWPPSEVPLAMQPHALPRGAPGAQSCLGPLHELPPRPPGAAMGPPVPTTHTGTPALHVQLR